MLDRKLPTHSEKGSLKVFFPLYSKTNLAYLIVAFGVSKAFSCLKAINRDSCALSKLNIQQLHPNALLEPCRTFTKHLSPSANKRVFLD